VIIRLKWFVSGSGRPSHSNVMNLIITLFFHFFFLSSSFEHIYFFTNNWKKKIGRSVWKRKMSLERIIQNFLLHFYQNYEFEEGINFHFLFCWLFRELCRCICPFRGNNQHYRSPPPTTGTQHWLWSWPNSNGICPDPQL
jgi:hypothetical protein